jgi:hypothetical protein
MKNLKMEVVSREIGYDVRGYSEEDFEFLLMK